MLYSWEQLERKVLELGFLPFFTNPIPGFSVEEMTPRELWFSDEVDGPWEWKGPVIRDWNCAYGKFFNGKAGYISLDWLPDFINWRRHLYPLDLMDPDAQHVYEVLVEHESLLSKELKVMSGFTLSRKKKFDPSGLETGAKEKNGSLCDKYIASLENATFVCIADFEYQISKSGEPYGWGVARYCTPEAMYGAGIVQTDRTAEESYQRIRTHLKTLFPGATDKQLNKFLQ